MNGKCLAEKRCDEASGLFGLLNGLSEQQKSAIVTRTRRTDPEEPACWRLRSVIHLAAQASRIASKPTPISCSEHIP
jgi:hypothetical protein